MFECCSSYYAVVNHHMIIHIFSHLSVSYVINMGYHVVAFAVLCDKCSHLYVLYSYVFSAWVNGEDVLQHCFVKSVFVFEYCFYLLSVCIFGKGFCHSLKGNRGCVRNVRNNRVLDVVIYCLQYSRAYQLSKCLSFVVNICVCTS